MSLRYGRILPMSIAALALSVAFTIAGPAPASAATYAEGTSSRVFRLADTGGLIVTAGSDPSLVVPLSASTVYAGAAIEFEPRSIALMPDDSYLVSCGKHGTIVRVSKDGRLLQQYGPSDVEGMQRPFDAQPTAGGGMLIVDRSLVQGEGFVMRVDASLKQVWKFGGTSGLGAGQVFDPFTARTLPGGHTLISDSLGDRVIEVDDETGAIVWSFGVFKVAGSDGSHLDRPHSAERLSNGDTLICDSNNQRVIEVSPWGRIVWRYGSGVAGSGTGQLANPNSAVRLANGDTLICDSDNCRVLEVDKAGTVVQTFGKTGIVPPNGTLSDIRVALRLGDGTTLIADTSNMRLASYGVAPHHEWVATSEPIDPQTGARKRFIAIRVRGSVPSGSALSVEYSINSGAWTDLQGAALPSDAIGTSIRYRLRLTTGNAAAAPRVDDVSIDWAIAGASSAPGSGTTRSATTRTSTRSGTGTGSGGGGASTNAQPGGTTDISGGTTGGGAGAAGDAVTPSNTLSGWVMSEVRDSAGSGRTPGGPGTGGTSLDSTAPGIALLLAVYITGVGWSPAWRLVTRVVTATMTK